MMDIDAQVRLWQDKVTDPELAAQLEELVSSGDAQALQDAFYRELEFGTAGLRGIIGVGSNRMNRYTVGKATQGLADHLNSLPGDGKSVAIAHDPRIKSDFFTEVAACILAANGIKACVYPRLQPTPALSFAVRELGCDAGINITASHNPKEYNGYKVYGSDGCQITTDVARAIQRAIDDVDLFDDVRTMPYDEARAAGLIEEIGEEVLDAFIDACVAQSVEPQGMEGPLKVVFTPLNGAGLECVTRILDRIGITDVVVVPEQRDPDGTFATCPSPNPEDRRALERGLALCDEVHPDLLVATDPDADRVGVAVADGDDYALLTGNEIGILLFDYLCRMRTEQGIMPERPFATTTIVSTDMVDRIAERYGVEVRRVLTGFKYIGEQITALEPVGEEGRFIFGFEESYGYLIGPHVRDKDAIATTMAICQMARDHRARGRSLVQAMEALYEEYGWYENRLVNVRYEGMDGARKMEQIMSGLRLQPPAAFAGRAVTAVVDYQPGIDGLPPANVIEFQLEGSGKVIIRPSGTEPKVKAYLFGHADTRESTSAMCAALETEVTALLRA